MYGVFLKETNDFIQGIYEQSRRRLKKRMCRELKLDVSDKSIQIKRLYKNIKCPNCDHIDKIYIKNFSMYTEHITCPNCHEMRVVRFNPDMEKDKKKMGKITTKEMETALYNNFNTGGVLIIPNVSWGMFNHECDLIMLSKAGYATEIEIKISRADLLKDKKKVHNHDDPKISKLFFAIPDYMEKDIDLIPRRAGIILVNKHGHCKNIRAAHGKYLYKFPDAEKYKLARLGSIRLWSYRRKIIELENALKKKGEIKSNETNE